MVSHAPPDPPAEVERRWRVLMAATVAFPVVYLFTATLLRGRTLMLATMVAIVVLAAVAAWTTWALPRSRRGA